MSTAAMATNVLEMPKRKAPPRRLRSDRTFLTREELARLMAAAKAHGPRTHAMVLLGFRHGLRVSEICRLRLVDDPEQKDSFLDTTSNTLMIRRLKGSSKTVQAVMASANPLFDEPSVIQAYLRVRKVDRAGDYLFASREGGSLDPSTFFRIFQDICADAGISKDKAFPHVLKHSRVSLLVKNGCEIAHAKVFVGHRSISSTMVYTQLNDAEATDAAAAIDAQLF
jgi:site-specific recombinase XerD